MHCSFCAQTIERAAGRVDGVDQVNVSVTHEEALIVFDPERVTGLAGRDTLRDIGYTLRDPREVRTFEEQEAELQTEGIGSAESPERSSGSSTRTSRSTK